MLMGSSDVMSKECDDDDDGVLHYIAAIYIPRYVCEDFESREESDGVWRARTLKNYTGSSLTHGALARVALPNGHWNAKLAKLCQTDPKTATPMISTRDCW